MPRKVILGFGISLDGYIARRNGAMDYLTIEEEGEALMADFFAKIDTTIMGRKTAAGWTKMRNSGEILCSYEKTCRQCLPPVMSGFVPEQADEAAFKPRVALDSRLRESGTDPRAAGDNTHRRILAWPDPV
jgi:hypothetical protein